MSALSEEVARAMNAIMDTERKAAGAEENEGAAVEFRNAKELHSTPGVADRESYLGYALNRAARRCVRHFGGRTWETSLEAMHDVQEKCIAEFFPVVASSLSDGVLMGRKPTPVIRKYTVMDDMNRLWTAPSFRTESSIQAMTLFDDFDLRNGLQRFLLSSAYVTGAACGMRNEGGFTPPHKIFELWLASSTSTSMVSYTAGYRLGKKWDEDDVLAGILLAGEAPNQQEEKSDG